jgi:hypothetical protein
VDFRAFHYFSYGLWTVSLCEFDEHVYFMRFAQHLNNVCRSGVAIVNQSGMFKQIVETRTRGDMGQHTVSTIGGHPDQNRHDCTAYHIFSLKTRKFNHNGARWQGVQMVGNGKSCSTSPSER